ncbi:RNA chaperone ProQ [Aliidiomarina halalkaliphila]|uniref:RNA chaperone ProQ n=1 Tax=Aliidiomarina halalkaliphila TaxID=2593535 RepID=A0A552X408_9GAMM|nr:RNA chaperone ProQ [Aliidiomarina halalkaliphila]TRW49725.1 RNA chaperone ProQ [Aliidiomarina halalkaliphila]
MEKSAKFSTSKEVIAYLAEQFPACFTLDGDARPLKIGIFEDLAARLADDEKVSKTRIRSALRLYTSSWRYLRGVKAGVQRVDLDGADAGLVEADHEAHAVEQLQASQARAKARKAELAAESKPTATKPRKQQNKPKHTKVKENKGSGPRKSRSRSADIPKRPQGPLTAVNPDAVTVGQQVQVQVGSLPVQGVVTDLEKNDAQVQLPSGMTVRVPVAELFRVG